MLLILKEKRREDGTSLLEASHMRAEEKFTFKGNKTHLLLISKVFDFFFRLLRLLVFLFYYRKVLYFGMESK